MVEEAEVAWWKRPCTTVHAEEAGAGAGAGAGAETDHLTSPRRRRETKRGRRRKKTRSATEAEGVEAGAGIGDEGDQDDLYLQAEAAFPFVLELAQAWTIVDLYCWGPDHGAVFRLPRNFNEGLVHFFCGSHLDQGTASSRRGRFLRGLRDDRFWPHGPVLHLQVEMRR